MIRLEFTFAVALAILIPLFLAIVHWMLYTFNSRGNDLTQQKRYLQQCPYCTYVFFDYAETAVKVCPRCKSYIGRQEKEDAGMWKRTTQEESGIALLSVLLVVLMIAILAVTTMSSNITQVSSSEEIIQNIQSEQLAKGVYWSVFMDKVNNQNSSVADGTCERMEGRDFCVSLQSSANAGLNGTELLTLDITPADTTNINPNPGGTQRRP